MPFADPDRDRAAKRESARRRRARERPAAAAPAPSEPGPASVAVAAWLADAGLQGAQLVAAAAAQQLAVKLDRLVNVPSAASGVAVAALHRELTAALAALSPSDEARLAAEVARFVAPLEELTRG